MNYLCKKQLFVILGLFISSCGGSGSTNTPVQAQNLAPNVSFTTDKSQVDEGQIFTLDGSMSRDPEGQNLSFAIRQISGPPASLTAGSANLSSNGSIVAFEAPEIGANTDLVFELSVSDSINTRTDTISVTLLNIDLEPKAGTFELPNVIETTNVGVDLLNPRGFRFLVDQYGTSPSPDNADNLRLFQLRQDFDDRYKINPNFNSTDSFKGPLTLRHTRFVRGGGTSTSRTDGLFLGSELDNKVFLLEEQAGSPLTFAVVGELEAENICDIQSPNDFMLLGKRKNGLDVVRFREANDDPNTQQLEFETEVSQSLGSNESFCIVTYIRSIPSRYVEFPGTGSEALIAIDTDGQNIHIYSRRNDIVGARLEYRLRDVIPFDLKTDAALEIKSFQVNSDAGDFVIAIALSDGEHDGQHELLVITQDPRSSELEQKSFTWSKGVPASIVYGALNNPNDMASLDIAVISSSSPQALLFADINTDNTKAPIFAEPAYFEVGLNATSAIIVDSPVNNRAAILIARSKTGEIVDIQPKP